MRTRIPSKLSDAKVKNAKPKDKAYKLSDGGGLFLLINPSGSKYWRLKYYFTGKEKTLAIGVYPDVSLASAREATRVAREEIAAGKDPSREKKLRKYRHQNNTFAEVAEEYWNQQKDGWKENHARRVWLLIEKEMFPRIGPIPVYDLTSPECLQVIQKVSDRGAHDVASRVKQKMESIFNYAISIGKATHNPVTHLTGVIKVRKIKHMKALHEKDLPNFLKDLETSPKLTDVVRYALQLIVHTFVRPGEIRYAAWEDFDLKKKEWRIPASKTKMGREHVVPLTKQAIAILEKIKEVSGELPYVFPGYRDHLKPISENALTYGIRKSLGYDATAHGFRTLASTTLNEQGFSSDVIERQLSHVEQNKIRGAYNRYEYIKERVKMMEWWSEHLEKNKKLVI